MKNIVYLYLKILLYPCLLLLIGCLAPTKVDEKFFSQNIKSIEFQYDGDSRHEKSKNKIEPILSSVLEKKGYRTSISNPSNKFDAKLFFAVHGDVIKIYQNGREHDYFRCFRFIYILSSKNTGEGLLRTPSDEFVYHCTWKDFEVLNDKQEIIYRSIYDKTKKEYSIYGPNAALFQRYTYNYSRNYYTPVKVIDFDALIKEENDFIENILSKQLENLPQAK